MSGKIYHYTDTAGLFGILNGSIWMTAVSYLNDSTEFDIGVMDIKDHLKKNFDSEVIAPNLIDDAFEEIKKWDIHSIVFESSKSAKSVEGVLSTGWVLH
ncbi:hypothetical protein [Vogesella sp. XCS3]|uniref:hypothetical protein n=1 Tax=Vogesella sp. XCS3 TaxID=2877939 RepID=UPI001D09C5C9|nr:hypothetical protein [Vogesella sp. XCS3]UDM17774.1 hypothetical protein LCH97_03680 [Vogesella sp. XCS3]